MLTVTIYSTPNCPQCRMTYFALDAREYVTAELGYSSALAVVVDQDPDNHWSGFRREKIAGPMAWKETFAAGAGSGPLHGAPRKAIVSGARHWSARKKTSASPKVLAGCPAPRRNPPPQEGRGLLRVSHCQAKRP